MCAHVRVGVSRHVDTVRARAVIGASRDALEFTCTVKPFLGPVPVPLRSTPGCALDRPSSVHVAGSYVLIRPRGTARGSHGAGNLKRPRPPRPTAPAATQCNKITRLESGGTGLWGLIPKGQAGQATGSSSSPCALGTLSAWPCQVRTEKRRHEARDTCHQTCYQTLTPCPLISAAWPSRHAGQSHVLANEAPHACGGHKSFSSRLPSVPCTM